MPTDPNPGGARLRDPGRLLRCLDADVARLRSVAAGADLARPVPTCPEWTLADLVTHVAHVYLHKVACMRLNANPDRWPPEGTADEPPLALLDRAYAELTAEFAARDPRSMTYTWYGPDQSVEFWIRRMAQETVIHRVDAELAVGAATADIPADLARDGVDEVLVAFLGHAPQVWPEAFESILSNVDGRAVRLRTAGAAWLVRPTPDGVDVRLSTDDAASGVDPEAAALISGEPAALLLWLWHRAGDDVVSLSGDPGMLATLRQLLETATQ
jgi:uncharacterized protein (TIGR03083 family)